MTTPEKIDTREPVVIQIKEYEGLERLDIRHWYSVGGHLEPTKKGVNVPTAYAQTLVENICKVSVGKEPSIMQGFGQTYVKVCRNVYKGKTYLDIRHYYAQKSKYAPTPKGVSIPWDFVQPFLKALSEMRPEYQQLVSAQIIELVPAIKETTTPKVEYSNEAKEWDAFEIGKDASKVTDNRFANIEL